MYVFLLYKSHLPPPPHLSLKLKIVGTSRIHAHTYKGSSHLGPDAPQIVSEHLVYCSFEGPSRLAHSRPEKSNPTSSTLFAGPSFHSRCKRLLLGDQVSVPHACEEPCEGLYQHCMPHQEYFPQLVLPGALVRCVMLYFKV